MAASEVAVVAGVWLSSILPRVEVRGGWRKDLRNPLLGGDIGTVFDVSVLANGPGYEMWSSWRPQASIAFSSSSDGISWSEPEIVLGPDPSTGWEEDVNRPVVLLKDGLYHMWYTGQTKINSWIGYATSQDGRAWARVSADPVLSPTEAWEKTSVMCPHVVWDERRHHFRMWYSGGRQFEPDAIGHAVSDDGIAWVKDGANPVFVPDQPGAWDDDRVTACFVEPTDDGYVMFYAGFSDVHHAQIGLARSTDGVTGWQRHPHNPIIRQGRDSVWDGEALYKASVLRRPGQWLLWYNGRRRRLEQIGLAIHEGDDLGF